MGGWGCCTLVCQHVPVFLRGCVPAPKSRWVWPSAMLLRSFSLPLTHLFPLKCGSLHAVISNLTCWTNLLLCLHLIPSEVDSGWWRFTQISRSFVILSIVSSWGFSLQVDIWINQIHQLLELHLGAADSPLPSKREREKKNYDFLL